MMKNLRFLINSFLVFVILLVQFSNTHAQTASFTTPGTPVWSPPFGVTSITVQTWGAGGGGGGATGNNGKGGGGGGGGGFNSATNVGVTFGNNYNVAVGAGGAGNNANGSPGGFSNFNGGTATANGGAGGTAATGSNNGSGGAGGVNTRSGGSGGSGSNTSSGGGGGSAGVSTNGGAGGAPAAGTAGTGTPGGSPGAVGNAVVLGANGDDCTTYGGGGAGGRKNSATLRSGGDGAPGRVLLSWTVCTAPAAPIAPVLISAATSISGSFTASGSPTGYLVIMTTTSTPPTAPVTGSNYIVGSTALGGTVIKFGTGTTFTATGLSANTQYWFWVYSYFHSNCAVAYSAALSASDCTPPSTQPTALSLTAFPQVVTGTFTASPTATSYLVVRTATASAPTSPISGTAYVAGATALGGTIVYAGAATTFTDTGLNPLTPYWYWVYAYSTPACGTEYLIASPTTGTTTTLACGSVTNTSSMPQTGSIDWNLLTWSLGHVPTSCENVQVTFTGTTAVAETVTLNITNDVRVNNAYFLNNSTEPAFRKVFKTIVASGDSLVINGNLLMRSTAVRSNDSCTVSSLGTTLIKGNAILSDPADVGYCVVGSTGSTPNQTWIFRGNVTFNARSYTLEEHTVFIFDGGTTQTITNNTNTFPFSDALLFDIFKVGDGITPTAVIFAGSNMNSFMNDKGGYLEILAGSQMILPANYTFNAEDIVTPNVFNTQWRMGANAVLKVGGFSGGTTGSNFPRAYPTYIIPASTTIHYNGNDGGTQTVFGGVTYGNLVISNGTLTGRAQKNTTANISVNTSMNILTQADLTLGNTVNSAGPLNVQTNGGLYCAANVVSGTGAFTLQTLGFLGMGHPVGISPGTTTAGNIQMMGGRSYSTSGNYIYNGIVNQTTGTGLPTTVNGLTIANTALNGTVSFITVPTVQTVNGINLLQSGTFIPGLNSRVIINGTGSLSSSGGLMTANNCILDIAKTGSTQTLSGSWFTGRNVSTLRSMTSTGITVNAAAGDTLLISHALLYGSNGLGSTITTNGNLTLLSRDTGTARFGEMTGNSISGTVNVERYMFARSAWRLLATPITTAGSPTVTQSWREGGVSTASTGYGTQITGPASFIGMDSYTQRASMKYYNGSSNTFIDVTNSANAIANPKGYYVFVRGDRQFSTTGVGSTILRLKGTLLTGNQTVNVLANKFESFGNPYASRINYQAVTKTNIVNAFTIWNPNSPGLYNVGAYETYTWNGTNYMKPGGAIRNFIESGEAVYVQSNSVTAGSLVIKESDKSAGSSLQSRTGVTVPTLEINMFTTGQDGVEYLADGAWLNFDSSYSAAVDNHDVRKFMNTADNLGIINGTYTLIVERRPELQLTDTIRFRLTGTHLGAYRFEIDPSVLSYPGLEAILKDKFLNTDTPLSLTGVTSVPFEITSAAGSNAFDRFMIVFRPATVLPVRFSSISAVRNIDKSVTVKWNSETEIAMRNYEIEHSADGRTFRAIGTAQPTNNNGGSAAYNFIDAQALSGDNFYRVKGNSFNGRADYTAVVKVGPLKAGTAITIYPNPIVDKRLHINFVNQSAGNIKIQVINSRGQVIVSKTISITGNNVIQTIDLPVNIATGNYYVQLMNEDAKLTTIPVLVQ